jgi:hypothetical protein
MVRRTQIPDSNQCVTLMTLPSLPAKKGGGGSLAPLIGIAIFVLIGVGVTGIVEQRKLQTNAHVSSSAILGEWRIRDNSARILFRADKTLEMSADGATEPGEYQLESAGMASVRLKNGRSFTATFREFTPNQFDLVDSETQGVRVFAKTP